MAVVTPTPTNPTIATDNTPVAAGLASAFRPNLNTYVGAVENYVQLAQAYIEGAAAGGGNGWVSGGSVIAGSGLAVSVAAFAAICGNYVATDAAGTVGSLTDNTTNYLWLRQDTTFTAGTANTAPTGDSHGTAVQWAVVTTSGGTVSAITEYQRPQFGYGFLRGGTTPLIAVNGTADITLTYDQYSARHVRFSGTAVGTVNALFPPIDAAEWWVFAGGSASIRCKVSGQTGIIVATTKRAILSGNGTDVVRISSDQ